jgi:hypothetical protein
MPKDTSHVFDETISIREENDEDDEEDVPLCNIVVIGEPEKTSPLEVASEALTEIPVAEVATTTQPGLQKIWLRRMNGRSLRTRTMWVCLQRQAQL